MERVYLLERFLGETRLALFEDNALTEIYYERPGTESLSGNIYLGRVQNVLPGMNAAFVDIGLDKNAYLCVSDAPMNEEGLFETIKNSKAQKKLKNGMEIPVQVIKEPGGTKGCRVSGHTSIPGRLTVLLPSVKYVGISKKIDGAEERARLHNIAKRLTDGRDMGIIMRTNAENADEGEIEADYLSLIETWKEIENLCAHSVAPRLVHSDTSLALRLTRDLLDETVGKVLIDGEELYKETLGYARQYREKLEMYTGDTPLFEIYGVERQIEKLCGHYVWLKSGGTLVIDETEALTVIDVNTGKFVGAKSLEETIYKLNREAAKEIARQIRLRDLGGIIIIDFIDMKDVENRAALLAYMRELMAGDKNRANVIGFTGLGLVEMTRKKVRRPMSKQLGHVCPKCGGSGFVPSYQTNARKLLRELRMLERNARGAMFVVSADGETAEYIKTLYKKGNNRVFIKITEGERGVTRVDELPSNRDNETIIEVTT